MSWRYHKSRISCVRKVSWDGLWHVVYRDATGKNARETYDRIDKRTANHIVKHMKKWVWGNEK